MNSHTCIRKPIQGDGDYIDIRWVNTAALRIKYNNAAIVQASKRSFMHRYTECWPLIT